MTDVPYDDAGALESWVRANVAMVSPLILERLLGHHGFIDGGPMPTSGATRCNVWKYRNPKGYPKLAHFRILVYYTDVVSEGRVQSALQMIGTLRQLTIETGEPNP